MRYDFITIGGATRDISFFTDQGILIKNQHDILRQELLAFEYGAKIKVDRFHYYYGGGAANAAVCLSRLSLKTACLTCLGGDENGRLIKKNLQERGIETKFVKVKKNEESASSFILIAPSGERIIFGSHGASRHLELTKRDEAIFKQTVNIYLASLSGKWLANLKTIFSFVTLKGPKVYWNPGGSQIRAGFSKLAPFLKKTGVFALNKDEAIEFVLSSQNHKNINSRQLNGVNNLLKIIHSFGPQVVVITMGSAGVAVYDGQKFYRQQALKDKKRVDTTGIGDVFNSSFAAAYSQFHDVNRALKLALSNAAAKVSQLGAQNGLIKKNLKR
jgi:ribokinase